MGHLHVSISCEALVALVPDNVFKKFCVANSLGTYSLQTREKACLLPIIQRLVS